VKSNTALNPEIIEHAQAEFNGNNEEKYLEVGKRTSEDIDSFLMEEVTKLKVQRIGSGIDTRYHVVAE